MKIDESQRKRKLVRRARPVARIQSDSFVTFRPKRAPYYSMGEVARIMSNLTGVEWKNYGALRWLKSIPGALIVRMAPGAKQARHYTTRDRLREALPEAWARMELEAAEPDIEFVPCRR